MDWVYSEAQDELQRTVRRFVQDKQPMSAVRQAMGTEAGYDPAVWRQMAAQLGLQALGIPEEYGGAGCGHVELGIVLDELGRALYPGPYFSSAVLAAGTLLACGDEAAKKELLPGLALGETIGTTAWVEDSGRWDVAEVSMQAARSGDGYVLTGRKNFVTDGHIADLILVAARTRTGLSLFAVTADAPGLSRTALPTLDPTRRLARLDFTRERSTGAPSSSSAIERDESPVIAVPSRPGRPRRGR